MCETLKTLTPKPTILNNLSLYEPIDIKKLKKLLNSSLLVSNFTNNYVKYDSERQQLEKYIPKVFVLAKYRVIYNAASIWP